MGNSEAVSISNSVLSSIMRAQKISHVMCFGASTTRLGDCDQNDTCLTSQLLVTKQSK